MKLSIVIVNYNSKKYLRECLFSIEKNIPKKFLLSEVEVVIVNNDKDALVLEKNFSLKIHIINLKENNGFGRANNVGVKKASGEFLFFLNPDTIIKDYNFFEIINFLEKNPSTGIIGPKIILKKENRPQPWTSGKKTTFWNIVFRNNFNKPWNKNKNVEVDWVSGTAFLTRKKDFEKIGGFDEKFFMYFEDQDLCLRIKKNGKKIIFYPDHKIIHLDGKSWSDEKRKKTFFYQSQDYFFKKHNPPWQGFLLKKIRVFFLYFQRFF